MAAKIIETLGNNHHVIESNGANYFQSYNSIIAVKSVSGRITLDSNFWNYSRTTGKYRNKFLGELKAATEQKIKDGIYTFENLN